MSGAASQGTGGSPMPSGHAVTHGEFESVGDRLNMLERGIMSKAGEVTLTANATTTTVTLYGCSSTSIVLLSPLTANAAAAIATTYIVPAKGQFVINHASAATTDRKFRFVVFSGIRK